MRCELAVTVSGNHRLQYAMTKLLACARGAGSYFCRVRFVLLSRAHGLSRGWALEAMYQVTGNVVGYAFLVGSRGVAIWRSSSDMLFWLILI